MKVSKYLSLALVLTVGLVACDDEGKPENKIDNPSTYIFTRDGESTVSFSGQTARIGMASELIDGMKDFSKSEEHLLEMFTNQTADGGDANPFTDATLNESTKSVRSKVAASNDYFSTNTVESSAIKAQFELWISAHVDEIYPNESEIAIAGQAGQLADGGSVRYVSAKGLEYNQAVNKGLIGALMTDQMLNNYLSPAVLDAGTNVEDNDAGKTVEGKSYTDMEHKWDEAYGYLFGASDSSEDPRDVLGQDAFLDKYLLRTESDADFTGIANKIYQAFKLGRAAIVAGEYDVRDEQADIIKEEISKIIGIRSVYYLQQGRIALEAENYGSAFHDLSEGYGFIYSLQFTRKPGSDDPYLSSSQVDNMIDDLLAGNGFWDRTSDELDEMSADIADKFDFTVAEAGE